MEKLIRYKTGWTFTVDEEMRLLRLGREADGFWAKLCGNGTKAEEVPMVDLRHYAQGETVPLSILERLSINRSAKKGAVCICPMCGREFRKSFATQTMCSNGCTLAHLSGRKLNGRERAVMQYDLKGKLLKEYPSVSLAVAGVGAHYKTTIVKCCNGKVPSAHGYVWRYKD